MSPALPRLPVRYLLPPVVLALLCSSLQLSGMSMSLRFDRVQIAHGEWWLILTGNLVHLGWSHLLLNLAGLGLIQALFAVHLRTARWTAVMLASSLSVGIGLYFLNPEVGWYVGLSGSLHGLFTAGAVAELHKSPLIAALLLGLLGLKLTWEQASGALPGTAELAGGNVIVDSHLYGAVAGFSLGLLQLTRDTWHRARIKHLT